MKHAAIVVLLISGIGCKPSSTSRTLEDDANVASALGTPVTLRMTYTSIDRLTAGIYEIQLASERSKPDNLSLTGWSIDPNRAKLYGDDESGLEPSGTPLNVHLELRLVPNSEDKNASKSKKPGPTTSDETNNDTVTDKTTDSGSGTGIETNPQTEIVRICGGKNLNPQRILMVATREIKINCEKDSSLANTNTTSPRTDERQTTRSDIATTPSNTNTDPNPSPAEKTDVSTTTKTSTEVVIPE